MNFNVTSTDLERVLLIERKKFNDDRGYFVEFFRNDFFQKEFKGKEFVQDNLSFSRKGVIRDLAALFSTLSDLKKDPNVKPFTTSNIENATLTATDDGELIPNPKR